MDKKSSGFTLVELIVVIAILGIIAAIAAPGLSAFKSKVEESICDTNRKTVEGMHSAFLVENDIDDISAFDQLLIEKFKVICPAGGVVSYEDGKVKCGVHEDRRDEDEQLVMKCLGFEAVIISKR